MWIGLEYFQEHDVTVVFMNKGTRTVLFIAKGKFDYDNFMTKSELQTIDEFMVDCAVEGQVEYIELAISIINKLAEKINWGLYL